MTCLLDYAKASAQLGISTRQLRKLWQERRIGGVKVGRFVRFRQEDLDRFVKTNERRALQ